MHCSLSHGEMNMSGCQNPTSSIASEIVNNLDHTTQQLAPIILTLILIYYRGLNLDNITHLLYINLRVDATRYTI